MIPQVRFLTGVVERKVYIVTHIGEDIGQIVTQGICHTQLCRARQLGLQLCLEVRDQVQLILHFKFLSTIAQILIDCRTSSKADQQGQPQYPINYVPLSSSHTHNVCARTFVLYHQHTGDFLLPN